MFNIAASGSGKGELHQALNSTVSSSNFQGMTIDQMIACLERSAIESKLLFQELKERMVREGKLTPEQMAELEQRGADAFAAEERMINEMFPGFCMGIVDLDDIGRRFAAIERSTARRFDSIQLEAAVRAANIQQEAMAKANDEIAAIDREVATMLSGVDQEIARLTDAGWGDVSGARRS